MAQRERWRRLPSHIGEPEELLAGADAMIAGLEYSHRPAIRWPRLAHAALFLGSSQRPAEVDLTAAGDAAISVHKRGSGGTAVYADAGHLWLDVALPAGHHLLLPDMTESYRWFGEVWARALAEAGIGARVVAPPEARALNARLDREVRRACFGGVSPYEVLVGDRKIVGLAQVRRRQGGLLQAGVYTTWEPECVSNVIAGTPQERQERTRLLRERAVGLLELAGPSIGLDDLIGAWERALVECFRVELVEDDWTAEERAAAEDAWERYRPLG